MGTIYLIRHGRSLANEGKFLGGKNISLSSRGVEETKAFAEAISTLKKDIIFVSEYERAQETAKILFPGEELHVTHRANEVDFGQFIGYSHDDLKANYTEEWNLWIRNPFQFAPPGGETLQDYFQNVALWMEDLRRQEEDVVIVTHDGFIRAFIAILFQNTEAYFATEIENCRLTVIKNMDGYLMLTGLNKEKL